MSTASRVFSKLHHFYVSLKLLNHPLALVSPLNIASETVSMSFWDSSREGWRSGSISEEIMACVPLRVIGPSFSSAFPRIRPITECAIQHHDYASVLSKSVSPQLLLTVEGFYVSPLRWLSSSSSSQISPENTNFPSFLCLSVSPFCYLTLQLYHLTLPSILTCSLLKSWKLILLLQTPPRLKICASALCIITFVDKRDKKFNKTQCSIFWQHMKVDLRLLMLYM